MHCKDTEHKNQYRQTVFPIQTASKLHRIRKRCLYDNDALSSKLQSEYTLEKTRQKNSMDFVRVSL